MYKAHRPKATNKFFTNPIFALECINKVFNLFPKDDFSLIVDPGAGNGSFFKQIVFQNIVALDILPEAEGIIQMDYFDYQPQQNDLNALVIGNPPFGRCDDLAIKFFNHSAQFSRVIAFILPTTFQHEKVQNQLNDQFHLIHDQTIPTLPCCFLPVTGMRCCFQIWVRKEEKRAIQIAEQNIQTETINKNPLVRLGEIATVLKMNKCGAKGGKDSGLYPFYVASEKKKLYQDYFDCGDECLLFSRGGSALILYPILPFACSTSVMPIKINSDNSTKFIYYYLKYNMNLIQEKFKGSALQHINIPDILSIQIPLISLERQNEIVEKIEEHQKKINYNNQKIKETQQSTDSEHQAVQHLINTTL